MDSKQKYTYNVVGFSILIFLIIRNYLPILLNTILPFDNTISTLFISIVSLILALLLPVFAIENLAKFYPDVFNRSKKENILPYIFFSQILFLAIALCNQIFIYIFYFFSNTTAIDQTLLPIENLFTFVLYYISIALVPSIFEEIFVRSYILNIFSSVSNFSALILSSLLFSLMHQNILQAIPAFFSSLVLGWIYLKTKNILACIGAHLLNNSYSFFMLYISQYVYGVSAVFFLIFINFCILILGFSSYFILRNKKGAFSIPYLKNKLDDRKNYILFLKSPAIVGAMACCLYTIIFVFKESLI